MNISAGILGHGNIKFPARYSQVYWPQGKDTAGVWDSQRMDSSGGPLRLCKSLIIRGGVRTFQEVGTVCAEAQMQENA